MLKNILTGVAALFLAILSCAIVETIAFPERAAARKAAREAIAAAPEPPASPADYITTTGFKPEVYRREGNITYTMLDVIPEGGDFLVYVSKQVIVPSQNTPDGSIAYSRFRADCRKRQAMYLGTGESVAEMMVYRPDPYMADLVYESSRSSGTTAACLAAGKL